MRTNFILLFTTLACLKISAQDQRVMIDGQISNDSIPLENIHIINKNSRKATISDKDGMFRIPVKENDELLISSIQFKNKVIIVNNFNIKRLNIKIILEKEIKSLDEVTLEKRRNIAGDLGLPNADKKPLTKLESRLNAHTKASLPVAVLLTLIGGAGGIDNLYYIISGNRKKDRKLTALLENDKFESFQQQQLQNIRIRLKDVFFIETLKMPKEEIDSFIKYCDTQDIFYLFSKNRTLEVIDILIKESKPYLKSLE